MTLERTMERIERLIENQRHAAHHGVDAAATERELRAELRAIEAELEFLIDRAYDNGRYDESIIQGY